jgi:cytochrome P450
MKAQVSGLESMIRSLTENRVDGIGVRQECEIVEDLAAPLLASITAEILGIEPGRIDDIRRWSDALPLAGNRPILEPHSEGISKDVREARAFLRNHCSRAAGGAGRGLFADLVGEAGSDDRLGIDEMVEVATLLLRAGSETTANLIGNAALLLARDGAWQERLRANVELIPAFLEEVLRYDAPAQRTARITTCRTQIGGVALPKAALVKVLIGSANRDPVEYPDADQFRIGRRPNRLISFGLGPHFCPGAQLGRLTASVALETLIRRQPAWTLARPGQPIGYKTSFDNRGPQRLELVFPSRRSG